MKNILICIITIFYGELSLGQNGFTPKFPVSSMNPVFTIMIIPDDPIKAVQKIQDFNQSSKLLGWRTPKVIQLDSIVSLTIDSTGNGWQRTIIRRFEYNIVDLVSSAYYFQIDPTGDTTGRIREKFNYNDLQQITQYDLLLWVNSTQTWAIYARQEFEYNDKDLLSGLVNYYYDGDSLQSASKNEITYNGIELPMTILRLDWDKVLLIWKEKNLAELSYTAFKKLSLETFSIKADSNSPWVYWSKTEYSYNQHLLLTKTDFYWNVNVWEREYRSYFYYDTQQNLILQADKVWMDPPQTWLDNVEYRYEYDLAQRRISAKDRRWFQDSHEWIIGDSTVIAYNEFSDTTSVVPYTWYSTTQQWNQSGFSQFSYNLQIDFSSIRWPMSFVEPIESTYNKQITEVLNVNRFNGLTELSKYYYSLIVASTEIPSESWSVYPNPATEEIHFNLPDSETRHGVELFDMNGGLVKTALIKNLASIPIQDIPSGMYVFRIKSGNSFLSGKFIKQ